MKKKETEMEKKQKILTIVLIGIFVVIVLYLAVMGFSLLTSDNSKRGSGVNSKITTFVPTTIAKINF